MKTLESEIEMLEYVIKHGVQDTDELCCKFGRELTAFALKQWYDCKAVTLGDNGSLCCFTNVMKYRLAELKDKQRQTKRNKQGQLGYPS